MDNISICTSGTNFKHSQLIENKKDPRISTQLKQMRTKSLKKKKKQNKTKQNGIQTHDLCDAGAVLYIPTELSSKLAAGHSVSS